MNPGLKEYKKKRDFTRTREPAGGSAKAAAAGHSSMFVVQKHAASRLHYDFRLQMEGVLKSWAVPRGFPTRKGDKRLAVHVEDHPVEYANFEGTIPEGSYGGGTVMVWDRGTYEVLEGEPLAGLERGKLRLHLRGEKLKGEWTLVRMRGREGEEKEQWLVLKSGADAKPTSQEAENRSVLTRRTLEQIGSQNTAQWQSDRASKPRSNPTPRRVSRTATKPASRTPSKVPGTSRKLPKAKPAFIEPMKALLVDKLPKGDGWTYEIKFDGVRAMAIKDRSKVRLISRKAKELTAKYPALAEAVQALPCKQAVIDGEIAALDPEGKSSFQLLQSFNMFGAKPPILYYAFDLLNLEGRDLTQLSLVERKEELRKLLDGFPDPIRFSASFNTDSKRLLKEMSARGLEGIIAKLKDSRYEIGARSGAWAKFKWSNEQEFVIGGYTPPEGARTHFGAILVGYYENGQLLFASKVGTGFNRESLELLHATFQDLVQPGCPFKNLPEKRSGRWGQGLTAEQMKQCTWLEPKLVCQIRFTEWTRDMHLRHPVFLGLREDKAPKEVTREKPMPVTKVG